jgi:hypothetical protein
MQLSHASSESLRDGKGFSSAQFESTSEYDYLFKILLLGTAPQPHFSHNHVGLHFHFDKLIYLS